MKKPPSTRPPVVLERAFDEALRLAREAATHGEVPVGAVVVHQGQIVGRGRNRREEDQDPVAHAEILALRDASRVLGSWRLNDCQLVVTLEPCPMCLAACQLARVEHVTYGATDPKGGAISLGHHIHSDTRLNHRFQVVYHPVTECGAVLSEFFRSLRASD